MEDLPTLDPDARTIASFEDSVEGFDALTSGLTEAGFDEVAADARQMADALDELVDALIAIEGLSPEEVFQTNTLRDQGNAVEGMPVEELADALGICS